MFYSGVGPVSKFSHVMLHLSPATRILSEKPVFHDNTTSLTPQDLNQGPAWVTFKAHLGGGGGILGRKILLLGINMTYINLNSTQKKAQMVTGCKG